MTEAKTNKPKTPPAVKPLVYLREALMLPGETLGDFGKEWRSLSSADRAELSDAARVELAKD